MLLQPLHPLQLHSPPHLLPLRKQPHQTLQNKTSCCWVLIAQRHMEDLKYLFYSGIETGFLEIIVNCDAAEALESLKHQRRNRCFAHADDEGQERGLQQRGGGRRVKADAGTHGLEASKSERGWVTLGVLESEQDDISHNRHTGTFYIGLRGEQVSFKDFQDSFVGGWGLIRLIGREKFVGEQVEVWAQILPGRQRSEIEELVITEGLFPRAKDQWVIGRHGGEKSIILPQGQGLGENIHQIGLLWVLVLLFLQILEDSVDELLGYELWLEQTILHNCKYHPQCPNPQRLYTHNLLILHCEHPHQLIVRRGICGPDKAADLLHRDALDQFSINGGILIIWVTEIHLRYPVHKLCPVLEGLLLSNILLHSLVIGLSES